MQSITLGSSDLTVSRLAYGCMRIAGTWNRAEFTPKHEAAGRAALQSAYENGYTLFDHADIYGRGLCEEIHGRFLAENPDLKSKTIIATKCGVRFPGEPEPTSPHRYDFSKNYIIESCEKSLERLQLNQVDLYQLHRPDILMNPHEVAEAFHELSERKLVKHFGVSNFTPRQTDLLQSALPDKLIVNQIEISLGELHPFMDGTIDHIYQRGMTPLAWSPIGGGWLASEVYAPPTGAWVEELAKLHHVVGGVAKTIGISRHQLCLAFLLKHPSGIVPIAGATTPAYIKEAADSAGINLSREDWYGLFTSARMQPLP